jgi:acyl-CoA synthetase (NDP forming)
MVRALSFQRNWHGRRHGAQEISRTNPYFTKDDLHKWIDAHGKVIGEDSLELIRSAGIPAAASGIARNVEEAIRLAEEAGYPVVMKVVSPDALHKTDAGGVVIGVNDEDGVRRSFASIRKNLDRYKKGARFEGVLIQRMADDGYDMFIGGKFDESFGPVVVFGLGGIYVEAFKDVMTCLCPADGRMVRKKVESLKSYAILKGARGMKPADIDGYVDSILRVSWILAEFPEIKEMDINPLRLLKDGSGICALDARMVIEKG